MPATSAEIIIVVMVLADLFVVSLTSFAFFNVLFFSLALNGQAAYFLALVLFLEVISMNWFSFLCLDT